MAKPSQLCIQPGPETGTSLGMALITITMHRPPLLAKKTEKLALTAHPSTTLKLYAKMFYLKRFSLLSTPTELKQQNL